MFVVVVGRGIPTRKDPMWGIFELDQAKALAAAGHQVVLAALDVRSARRPRRYGIYLTTVEGLNAVVVSLPLGAVGPSLTATALSHGWRRAYRRIVEEFGTPDVVHAHFNRFGAAAADLKAHAGYRLVLTEHSWTWDRALVGEPARRIAAKAYEAADALIAVSPSLAHQIEAEFGVKARCIPNILDTEAFGMAEPVPHAGLKLVSVGNLTEIKRMELLIDTFALALARDDAWLTIIGSGPLRARLSQRISELGLTRVRLLGRLTRAEIAAEFSTSDAFVLLSERETFGVVLIEAMAAGLPVLASRSGGPEDFITPEVGVLVDTDDFARLALALRDFVDSLGGYERTSIRRFVLEHFSPALVAASLTEVYNEVLNRP